MVKYYILVNVLAVVKMDKHGRILIPASIRKKINSDLFIIEIADNEIKLKPVKPNRLTSYFDRIVIDIEDFTDTHKLRKALMKS